MEYSRLLISLTLLSVIIFLGTIGYSICEGMPAFDAFYMTIITISTVGFSEIKPLSQIGRIITIIVIVSGISILTYTLGQVVKIFIEGELRSILGRRKLEKQILELKDHYIICGYGRIGTIISHDKKLKIQINNNSMQKDSYFSLIEQRKSFGLNTEYSVAPSLNLESDLTVEFDYRHLIDIPEDNKAKRLGFRVFQEAVKLGALLRTLENTIYWLLPLNTGRDTVDEMKEITVKAIKKAL